MITAQDLKGVLAIMPTPAKEGADRLEATNTVDLDETARIAESLVRDGANGIMALGTMGECATTSQSDYEVYVDCLLKTVRGRIPTFVGTTALGGHEIARRIKFVKERGATGTLLGIPMWQPATLDMAVKFYADVAATFPGFPIMVYANPRAFRFPFDVDFWGQVVDKAPTVMSAKFSSKAILKQSVEASKGRVNFVPPVGLAYEFAQISPASQTTCWMPSVGPQVGLALMKALADGNAAQAKSVAEDIAWANEPHHAITGSQEVFASYNIQMEKILMAASGYCKTGPIRPPYNVMPEDFRKSATEGGQRYAKLREKYSKLFS
ncbi:MAG TPA: dihydrodipicolinate synthase family protein [Terriglobales bacterium]|jgi:dihydrodipicolinate synthase/N-acetylneuraminate lyase|nr:dihydrodipicolinate synthase family protein [Terriglobales bacterium]